jgi:Lamin Tail Domain
VQAQVVVNEVSDTGTTGTCGGPPTDWIELQNRGSTSADISLYTLYDDAGPTSATKYTFPSGTVLSAGGLLVLCRTATFSYGIGGTDMITLANPSGTVVSTTGVLLGLGTTTTTLQLRNDGITYAYALATPNAVNVFPPPDVVVNEVASTGNANVCASGDYIELFNRNPSISNIDGWILRDDSNNTYIIPTNTSIAPKGYILFCQSQFVFGISGTDTITLYDPSNVVVSTSGKLSGGSSTSTFSRRTNGNFSYTKPSPNAENIFFSPLFGSIFVNEVASTAVAGVCAAQDYIELLNGNSTASFDLTGFLLHDDNGPTSVDAYKFPNTTILLAPNEVRLLCGQSTFIFGIGGADTITLLDTNGDLISTTGKMLNLASATSTFQLSSDRTGYLYGTPSPGASNVVAAAPKIVINEVADKAVPAGCNGTDYIELFNEGTGPADISNYRLRDDDINHAFYFIPNNTIIPPLGYILFCESQFIFGIGGTDTITLFNTSVVAVATTGVLLGLGSTTLTYSRRPNGNYAYTKPSPNAANIFVSPVSDIVFVNEVANTGVAGVCAGQDWVELINTGAAAVNLSGFLLHDDAGPNGPNAFLFPSNYTVLSAGEIRVLCGSSPGNFQFGISGSDTITLLDNNFDLVSTTGVLPNLGTSTLTYQRTSNNTYQYASPTPGVANFVASGGKPVINEIAPSGTSSAIVCGGGPYIEILNDAFAGLDLAGYVLNVGSAGNYTFPTGSNIASGAFLVLCQNTTYALAINANETITITNATGSVISSSGRIGGNNTRPNALDLTWARVVDLINPSAPFAPFYQYSINPTPGIQNVFSFDLIVLPRQPCGIQAGPLAPLNQYMFKELLTLDLGSRNPEFSGSTFDPRTCNNLIVGDEGNLNEIAIFNSTLSLLRTVPVIGGSTDTEGVCYWYNEATGESKLVIVDERDRSGKSFFSLLIVIFLLFLNNTVFVF